MRERGRLHLDVPRARWRRISSRFAKHLEPYFLPHKLHQAKVAFESTIIEQANWKLVWENNRECYHCAANHPELIRTFPEDPTATGVEDAASEPDDRREVGALGVDRTAEQIPPVRQRPVPHLAHAAARGGGELHHGRQGGGAPAAVDRIAEPDIGTLLLFHFPTHLEPRARRPRHLFRVLPLSPTETQLTTKWLVHKDAVEGVDYDLKRADRGVARDQCGRYGAVCQENQIGVNSPGLRSGALLAGARGRRDSVRGLVLHAARGQTHGGCDVGALAAAALSGTFAKL